MEALEKEKENDDALLRLLAEEELGQRKSEGCP